MVWMLLVYVVVSNGFNSPPSVTPSFHGATYASKEECTAAAASVSVLTAPGTDDISKVGLVTVCAPVPANAR